MVNIQCPYCKSFNTEEVDLIGECDEFVHLSYVCDCDEYFYVRKEIDVVKVEVSKDKWSNYKTVYDIG